jgi:hypothetical protein
MPPSDTVLKGERFVRNFASRFLAVKDPCLQLKTLPLSGMKIPETVF